MSLSRWPYVQLFFIHNDVLGPLETYDYSFISAAPQEVIGLLALISIFDQLTWAFLLASVFAVTLALVTINRLSNMSPRETTYQSKINSREKRPIFFLMCVLFRHNVLHGSNY